MIAKATGIGRATQSKYYPDVPGVLAAKHLRQIEGHLRQLTAFRDEAGHPTQAVTMPLTANAQTGRRLDAPLSERGTLTNTPAYSSWARRA